MRGGTAGAAEVQIAGEMVVAASPGAVFAALRDARLVASCLEGVRDLAEVDATHYTATMEVQVAYVRLEFQVAVETVRLDPEEVVVRIEGRPARMVGRLTATAVTQLEALPRGTRVRYETEVALTGKLGSLGQAAIRSKAKELEARFADRFRARLAGAPALPEAAP